MRISRLPDRYVPDLLALTADEGKPQSFREAMEGQSGKKWLKVIKEELDSLEQNATYNLVELPHRQKALKNK